jgi:transcriptional regulator with XRE-family HTH domain
MKNGGISNWQTAKKNFGYNVKFIRILADYSLKDFAVYLSCSKTYLFEIENSERKISIEILHGFSSRLNVPLYEMLREMNTNNPWQINWNKDKTAFDLFKIPIANPFPGFYI